MIDNDKYTCYIFGRQPINAYCFPKGTLANSADPDQMPRNAACDQSLHCLLKNTRISVKKVNKINQISLKWLMDVRFARAEESTGCVWVKTGDKVKCFIMFMKNLEEQRWMSSLGNDCHTTNELLHNVWKVSGEKYMCWFMLGNNISDGEAFFIQDVLWYGTKKPNEKHDENII